MAILYLKFVNVVELFFQQVSSLYIDYSKMNKLAGLDVRCEQILPSGGKF